MGQLKNKTRGCDNAERDAEFAVGPTLDDGEGVALVASVDVLTGIEPGDMVQVYANDFFHAAFCDGTDAAAVATTPGPFAPGVYRWACPDGCTKVAMIQATGAVATGGAFKG